MKLKWIAAIIITTILCTGILIYRYNIKNYDIVYPTTGDITETIYGLGKVKAKKRYDVVLGVMSTVSSRYVNEGDFVEAGKPLIAFGRGIVFRAPFAGTVTSVTSYPGETAVPGVPILRLEDLENRYIEISLEQQAILRVQPGQKANISFESLRGKIFTGKVLSIFPKENEFFTHVTIDNLDKSVLPGMSADVGIEIGQIKNVTLIPLKAIHNGTVTVLKDNKWKNIQVEVDHIDGINAEIKDSNFSSATQIRVRKGI